MVWDHIPQPSIERKELKGLQSRHPKKEPHTFSRIFLAARRAQCPKREAWSQGHGASTCHGRLTLLGLKWDNGKENGNYYNITGFSKS